MPNFVLANTPPSETAVGNSRWWICALLFFAATVNYMDRQVLSLLKPMLQTQFRWTEDDYSNIVIAFQFAYGAGVVFVGKLIDWVGTRKGFSIAVFLWSIAAMAHAAAGSALRFEAARVCLGLGEAGSFPASVKQWPGGFRKRSVRWPPASSILERM
jgi:MFS transporter, ACS family, hexuronate transporter